MRFIRMSPMLTAVLALFITGCGKTQEQQKLESNENAEVVALRNDVDRNLAGFADLQERLDATLKMHGELVKKYAAKMKGHTTDDLAAAKQGLDAAKGEAEAALKALSTYDMKLEHEQAMQKLNQDKQSLIKVKDVVAGAVSAANAAIENHEKMKTSLMAKAPAKASAKKVAPKKTKR
jgi:hypothetical protein